MIEIHKPQETLKLLSGLGVASQGQLAPFWGPFLCPYVIYDNSNSQFCLWNSHLESLAYSWAALKFF